MKVYFYSHIPFSLGFGGLEIQVLQTAEALRNKGIEVEFLDYWKREFTGDILHVFGSEYHLEEVVSRAVSLGIPTVVSAVFVPMLPPVVYKAALWTLRRLPIASTFVLRSRLLTTADAVIAQTKEEAHLLRHIFGVSPHKLTCIGNGINEAFFHATPDMFVQKYNIESFLLCVGTIEPRKNQLLLLEALADDDIPLVLIGREDTRFGDYCAAVRNAINSRPHTLWIEHIEHGSPLLASAFAAAKVHILASTSESHGLVGSEALAAGTTIIMPDKPNIREIFGESAIYCTPTSSTSIRDAVREAFSLERGAPVQYAPPQAVMRWEEVANSLAALYADIVKK